jgi:hypothetical protein
MKLTRSRTILAVSIAVALGLAVVSAVAVSALKGGGDHMDCAGVPQRHVFGVGPIPGGGRWSATGDVRSNGGCSNWLLGVNFFPYGTAPGSWRKAWDIPADGHLPYDFTIGAQDEASKSLRAFSGIVGVRVKRIKLRLRPDGRTIMIHPRLPSSKLRQRFSWLRNFRFFVRFLPSSNPVGMAKLIDSRGQVIFSERPFEGSFEGQY